MKRLGAQRLAPGARRLAPRRVGGRRWRQPLFERLEVKPGSARHDGERSVGLQAIEQRACCIEPARDGERMVGIRKAEQSMRDLGFFGRRRPGRQDPQLRVNLHGIGVDDRSARRARQSHRNGGFAARRRACNKHALDFVRHCPIFSP